MQNRLCLVVCALVVLSGCASVPMESQEKSETAKKFAPPPEGKAGMYVYRSGSFGGALKKDIWIDGECIGQSAPNVFFYEQVQGDVEHKLSTESEFSPNDLIVKTESGNNYFVRQFIKMGVMVGGAGLELVEEEKGKADVSKLQLAIKGPCSG